MSINEPRIYGTPEEEAEYKANFRAIEGMEERKQEVLARLRKEKEAKRSRSA